MLRGLLAFVCLALSAQALAVPTYGGDATVSASGSGASISTSLTLGASGSGSVLIVIIDAQTNFSAPVISYNGVAMTSMGAVVQYSGSTTVYRQVYYAKNPVSGQTLSIANGAPTTLNNGGANAWQYEWFTYSGVDPATPIGSTDIGNSHNQTSSSGSAQNVNFSFTPSNAGSTVLHMAHIQGNTCANSLSSTGATVRRAIQNQSMGSAGTGWGFSDRAPGSTSAYSVSQGWTPGSCSETFYGWAIELLPPLATNTPTQTPSNTPTQTPGTQVGAGCASGMTINGSFAEAAWSTVSYSALNQCWMTCGGSDTAQFKLLYDSTNLYIAVDVTDPSLRSDSGTTNWQDDYVEIYFGKNASGNSYASSAWQYTAKYDGSNLSLGAGTGNTTGISVVYAARAGGYTQEWSIPWSKFGVTPANGAVYAFDIGINYDDDGGSTREFQRGWQGNNTAWSDPAQFGTVQLAACLTPSPTPTPMSCGTPTCSGSWTVIGSGSTIPGGVHLTDASAWQATAMWSNFQLDLSTSWTASYDLYFGNNDAGADGIAFVMHNDPRGLSAIGDNGAGMSYASTGGVNGAISPSVDVEFDTYQNTVGPNFNDPAYDHAAIHLNGNGNEASAVAGPVAAKAGPLNIEDGAWHRVVLTWNKATNTLSVSFDGSSILTYTNDIITNVFGGTSCVYWGFTSGTGDAYNVHEAKEVSCYSPTSTVTPTPSISQTPTRSPTWTVSPTVSQTPSVTTVPTSAPAGCGGPTLVSAANVVSASNSIPHTDGSGCYNTSNTYSVNAGAGANRLLVVRLENQIAVNPTLIWYGGITLTVLRSDTPYSSGQLTTYYALAPPTGSNNLVITFAGSNCNYNVVAEVYADVNQSTPFGGSSYNSGLSGLGVNTTVTASSASSILSDFLVSEQVFSGNSGNGVVTGLGAGQTNFNLGSACCEEVYGDYRLSGGTGSQVFTYSYQQAGKKYSSQLIEIMPYVCTPTITPSSSSTSTKTPTNTITPSVSPTPTYTITATRTVTPTPTITPSATPSNTPQATPSFTQTVAATRTNTPTMPLVKTSNVSQATIGDTITFCIAWTNNASSAQTVHFWDSVSPYLTYVGCSNSCTKTANAVAWSVSAAPGASGSSCFWGTVSAYPP